MFRLLLRAMLIEDITAAISFHSNYWLTLNIVRMHFHEAVGLVRFITDTIHCYRVPFQRIIFDFFLISVKVGVAITVQLMFTKDSDFIYDYQKY